MVFGYNRFNQSIFLAHTYLLKPMGCQCMLCFGQISFNLWSEFVTQGLDEKQEKMNKKTRMGKSKKNRKENKLKLMAN